MSVATEIRGDKQLERLLKHLPMRVRKRVARAAISAGTTPVLKQARRLVPQESGTLKKAQGRRIKTYKDGATVGIVGTRRGVIGDHDGQKRVPANYDHLVHDGHINADGSFTPGSPYLETAFKATEDQQVGSVRKKMREGIVREARKLGRAG